MAAETTTATATAPKPAETKKKEPDHPRDLTREIFETLVFVVVLVLLLKLFVAEAFVIPTGSMAPSLWGDQVRCTCRECGHKFPINGTINTGANQQPVQLSSYICENCGYQTTRSDDVQKDFDRVFPWSSDRVFSGDRVLVAKYAYHLREPKRFDVPVFKYPVEPYTPKEMQGMNYIKRLVAAGGDRGETIAVFGGDLYASSDIRYDHIPTDKRPPSENDAWQFPYMYPSDPVAIKAFEEGRIPIVRKTPDQIEAMRRIVFDLDKQPKSRTGIRRTRWHAVPDDGAGWDMEPTGFRHSGANPGWMRYQHINPWREDEKAYYITDHIGYNAGHSFNDPFPPSEDENWAPKANHWVSDLILDCTVEIPSPETEIILELNKGPVRVQAIFARGECRLVRYVKDGEAETRIDMGSQSTRMKDKGSYALRLANVDCRLTVWVDKKPVAFSAEQCEYPPPPPTEALMPTASDKLQPARIGARGDVKVSKVSLWRDLHYNCAWRMDAVDPQHPLEPKNAQLPKCDHVQTYYVQPHHYLMFGDNTNSSKDSRSWGLVPKRLMLGRAVVVYWPLSRLGVIE